MKQSKISVTKKGKKSIAVNEPCLYCGQETQCQEFIINPGARPELPCCSEDCFSATKDFIKFDVRYRTIFYLVMLVLVIANLILLGSGKMEHISYLPMLGMGCAIFAWPLIFTRYERYQKYGIHRTQVIIRVIAVGIALFALLLTLSN